MKRLITFSLVIFCNVAGMDWIREYLKKRQVCKKDIPHDIKHFNQSCGTRAMDDLTAIRFDTCNRWRDRLDKQVQQCEKRGLWKEPANNE